jgi:hypothetical protein
MLSIVTPELWTPKVFPLPQLPDLDPAGPTVADFKIITSYVGNAVPLVIERPVYRASLAENKGGSCFAQTDAVVGTLVTLGITKNFVELGFPHANNVSVAEDSPIYLDAQFKEGDGLQVRSTPIASSSFKQEADTLTAHRKFIESVADGEPSACYFWFDQFGKVKTHVVQESLDEITPEDMNVELENNPHILITGLEGVAMLHAVGDLKRYRSNAYVRKNGTDRFETARHELAHLIPAFIKISDPDVSLAGA